MFKNPKYWTRTDSKEAVIEIKKRVQRGEIPNHFYSELGYGHPMTLYNAFKNIEGCTIREWAKKEGLDYNPYRDSRIDCVIQEAKKKIEQSKTLRCLDEIVKKSFNSWSRLSASFKLRAGISPREYLKRILGK